MVSKLEFVNIMETEYKAVTKFESWLGVLQFFVIFSINLSSKRMMKIKNRMQITSLIKSKINSKLNDGWQFCWFCSKYPFFPSFPTPIRSKRCSKGCLFFLVTWIVLFWGIKICSCPFITRPLMKIANSQWVLGRTYRLVVIWFWLRFCSYCFLLSTSSLYFHRKCFDLSCSFRLLAHLMTLAFQTRENWNFQPYPDCF